ncbi:MAG TPA: hypothetical protein PLM75_07470 [bacterium]|nr:hypothetical protein [bacterium]
MINRILNIIFIVLFCIIIYLFFYFFPDLVGGDLINQKNASLVVLILLCVFLLIYAINEFLLLDKKIKRETKENKLKLDALTENYENKINELKKEIEFLNNKLVQQKETLYKEYEEKLNEYKIQTDFEGKTRVFENYKGFVNNLKNAYLEEFKNIFSNHTAIDNFRELKNNIDKINFLLGNICYSYYRNVDIFSDNVLTNLNQKVELFSDDIEMVKKILTYSSAEIYISQNAEMFIDDDLKENKALKKINICQNSINTNILIVNEVDLYIILNNEYFYIFNNQLIQEFRSCFIVLREYQNDYSKIEDIRKLPF